jgi:hypothetical protein
VALILQILTSKDLFAAPSGAAPVLECRRGALSQCVVDLAPSFAPFGEVELELGGSALSPDTISLKWF